MESYTNPRVLQARCLEWRRAGLRVGFVPTMGALHEGHLSLVNAARESCDKVVVSVFVNPLQFAPTEDLDAYPRTLEADREHLLRSDVDALFHPSSDALYPPNHQTKVVVSAVSQGLCGAHRPGHFEGVTTVVLALLQIVQPHAAYFGKKDYQQWRVLDRMVRDLFLPVEIHGLPIIREPDGLAMSSRNAYLDEDQRARALGLWRGLQAARDLYAAGERCTEHLEGAARKVIEASADKVDYVELRDAETLEKNFMSVKPAVMLVAAHIGTTRLIDNWVFGAEAF